MEREEQIKGLCFFSKPKDLKKRQHYIFCADFFLYTVHLANTAEVIAGVFDRHFY